MANDSEIASRSVLAKLEDAIKAGQLELILSPRIKGKPSAQLERFQTLTKEELAASIDDVQGYISSATPLDAYNGQNGVLAKDSQFTISRHGMTRYYARLKGDYVRKPQAFQVKTKFKPVKAAAIPEGEQKDWVAMPYDPAADATVIESRVFDVLALPYQAFDPSKHPFQVMPAQQQKISLNVVRAGGDYVLVLAGEANEAKMFEVLENVGLKAKVEDPELRLSSTLVWPSKVRTVKIYPLDEALAKSIRLAHGLTGSPAFYKTHGMLDSHLREAPEDFLPEVKKAVQPLESIAEKEEAGPSHNADTVFYKALDAYGVQVNGMRQSNGEIRYVLECKNQPSGSDSRVRQEYPDARKLLAALSQRSHYHFIKPTVRGDKNYITLLSGDKGFAGLLDVLQTARDEVVTIAPFRLRVAGSIGRGQLPSQFTFSSDLLGQVVPTLSKVELNKIPKQFHLYLDTVDGVPQLVMVANKHRIPADKAAAVFERLDVKAAQEPQIEPLLSDEQKAAGLQTPFYSARLPIHPDVYADLLAAKLPALEESLLKTFEKQAAYQANEPSVAYERLYDPDYKGTIDPERKQKALELQGEKLLALMRGRHSEVDEFYLARMSDGTRVQPYALMVVPRPGLKMIHRLVESLNTDKALLTLIDDGDQVRVGSIPLARVQAEDGETEKAARKDRKLNRALADADYSIVRVPLPEAVYAKLCADDTRMREQSDSYETAMLASYLPDANADSLSEATVVSAEAAAKKLQHVAQGKIQDALAKATQLSRHFSLGALLSGKANTDTFAFTTVRLPELATLDAMIAAQQADPKAWQEWYETLANPPLDKEALEQQKRSIERKIAGKPKLAEAIQGLAQVISGGQLVESSRDGQVKQLQQLREVVALHGTDFDAMVIRGPMTRFGGRQVWSAIKESANNPTRTSEYIDDSKAGIYETAKTRAGARSLLRVNEVNLGVGRKNESTAAICLLSPALAKDVRAGLTKRNITLPTLGDQPIIDGQVAGKVTDYFIPSHMRIEIPSLGKAFEKLGTKALVTFERAETPEEYKKKGRGTQSVGVLDGQEGAQPALYLAVKDGDSRKDVVNLLLSLQAHGGFAGQKHYLALEAREQVKHLPPDGLRMLAIRWQDLKHFANQSGAEYGLSTLKDQCRKELEHGPLSDFFAEQMLDLLEDPRTFFLGGQAESTPLPLPEGAASVDGDDNETSAWREELRKEALAEFDRVEKYSLGDAPLQEEGPRLLDEDFAPQLWKALEEAGEDNVVGYLNACVMKKQPTPEQTKAFATLFENLPDLARLREQRQTVLQQEYETNFPHKLEDNPYLNSVSLTDDPDQSFDANEVNAVAVYDELKISITSGNSTREIFLDDDPRTLRSALNEALKSTPGQGAIVRATLSDAIATRPGGEAKITLHPEVAQWRSALVPTYNGQALKQQPDYSALHDRDVKAPAERDEDGNLIRAKSFVAELRGENRDSVKLAANLRSMMADTRGRDGDYILETFGNFHGIEVPAAEQARARG